MSTKTTREFKLNQVFALWKNTSKEGKSYFSGKYGEAQVTGFYNTKKQNPKEPDLRIYSVDADKKLSKEPILSLWCNVSKSGNKYLSGKLEGKRVIGFINEKATADNKIPYISIYWSEDQEQKQEENKPVEKTAEKTTKKAKKEEPVETDDDLPF